MQYSLDPERVNIRIALTWNALYILKHVPNTDIVSRKAEYKDVYRRTIEIPQRTLIFKDNCYLNVDNASLKLASSISGQRLKIFSFQTVQIPHQIAGFTLTAHIVKQTKLW